MKLKDFIKETKDFDEDTEILINGNEHFNIKYVDLLYDNMPPYTKMCITSKIFYKKRLEIELYR